MTFLQARFFCLGHLRRLAPSEVSFSRARTLLQLRSYRMGRKDGKPAEIRNHNNVPMKDCVVCGRPFTWRKKWEKCWDEVTTCSKRCNAERRQRHRGAAGDDGADDDGDIAAISDDGSDDGADADAR